VARDERREQYQPAVGYLRRSTDRQEQSIGDQRRAIERYAGEHGFEVRDYYTDDAISGTTADERKAFLRLIEDAKASDCPFRFVLVYDIKRFGRLDNDEAGYYRFQLRQAGVEVVYVVEGFNGDDTDDLLRPVKQWQARQECKDLSRVTIRGLLSRCDGGWWNGGTPPYGYDLAYFSGDGQFLMTVRYQPDCSKLALDEDGKAVREVPRGESLTFSKRDRCRLVPSAPDRVEVVRNIFNWYVHDGLGFKGIADRLNQQGIQSPRAGHWSSHHGPKWAMTTIRDMLLNPAYVGDFVWNRLTFAKFHRIRKGRAEAVTGIPGKGPEQNRPDDWVVVRDAHPALISRTLFEEAQRKRAARRERSGCRTYRGGRGATSAYLLSGLIRCQRCGHNWQGYTTRKGRKKLDGSQVKTRYYACNGYIAKGTSCCERAVIPQEFIETWVLEQIGGIMNEYLDAGGEKRLRKMIEQEVAGEGRGDGTELSRVRQRRADIEATIDNLLDNITPTNRDYVDRRIGKVRDEMVELERHEAALLEQQDRERQAQALAERAIAMARDFDRLVEVGTVDEKRSMVRAFLRGIDYDPESASGKAHFWLIPYAEADDGQHSPGGRGRRSDLADHAPAQASIGAADTRRSLFPFVSGDTRYAKKRSAAGGDASSFHMVAGAGYATKVRTVVVEAEVHQQRRPFEMQLIAIARTHQTGLQPPVFAV